MKSLTAPFHCIEDREIKNHESNNISELGEFARQGCFMLLPSKVDEEVPFYSECDPDQFHSVNSFLFGRGVGASLRWNAAVSA